MSWDHIGKPISTADAAASVPTHYQKFRITSGYRNVVVKTIMAGLFFYNSPAFGTVKLEIWSADGSVPGRLIASSDSYTQAECNTDTFVYRVMGFTFSNVPLKKNTYYFLVVRPSAYTGNDTSHIAWRQSWPDPQYPSGITLTLEYGNRFPYECEFETADL